MELVYPPVIAVARTLFRLEGLKFTITGGENVPRQGGAVMAINHVGYMDFTYAGLAAQPAGRLVRFMAKEEVFRHPVSGPLMRGMRHIPVDRTAGAASFRAAVTALRRGEVVGVFPEATISRSFELKEFKSGAARLALDAGVPLLPTVIWGSQRVWTKDHPKNLRHPAVPISVAIGEPIPVAAGVNADQLTVALRDRMAEMLAEVQKAYEDAPAGEDDRWWLPARLGGTAPVPEDAARLDDAERRERTRRFVEQAKARKAKEASGAQEPRWRRLLSRQRRG